MARMTWLSDGHHHTVRQLLYDVQCAPYRPMPVCDLERLYYVLRADAVYHI
jgi:hypothetical protein